MTLLQGCFAYLGLAIVSLSIVIVTRKNPVHSVMVMLVLFVHIASLYLFLNAEFLAAIQVIVYAGAVLVLYLFVVMLLNIREEEQKKRFQNHWQVSLLGVTVFLAFFIFITKDIRVIPSPGEFTIDFIEKEGSLLATGKVLFTTYLMPFEVVSLLLLVAIIGAVILTKKQ